MNTLAMFNRVLDFMGTNNPYYNVQLYHLEQIIDRRKLQNNSNYRNAYRRIRNRVGQNYNARVARGRDLYRQEYATLIQRHWRGMSVRRPKTAIVVNPNNGMAWATTVPPSIIKKLRNAKIARNKNSV